MKTCRAHPWSKFFWADWESDEGLRQCSLAAQGLWMRMLCICAKSDRHGYLLINGTHLDVPGLATAVSRPATEVAPLLDELDRWGVFSRNSKGQILSRRMVRDAKKSADGKKAKIEGIKNGMKKSPEISRKSEKLDMTERIENKDVSGLPSRVPIRGASTQKPEARSQKESSPAKVAVAARAGPVEKSELDQIEASCRQALGESAPADFVVGPMVLAVRKHSLSAVVLTLQSEVRRPRKKPIRTWALWAQIVDDSISGDRSQVVQPTALDLPDDRWRSIMSAWRGGDGHWAMAYGPRPGQSGCRVPEAILGEFSSVAA